MQIIKSSVLGIAAALLVGTAGGAMAQAPYGNYPYFAPGYVSGWGAPPSTLPYPACSTYPDFGNSAACQVPSGNPYGPPPPYGAYFYPPYW